MGSMSECLAVGTTAGAALTVSTVPCAFVGVNAVNSGGAGSLVVVDGATIIARATVTAGVDANVNPTKAIACRTNLKVTGSGAINYVVYYGV
jgi:hypothetical protein